MKPTSLNKRTANFQTHCKSSDMKILRDALLQAFYLHRELAAHAANLHLAPRRHFVTFEDAVKKGDKVARKINRALNLIGLQVQTVKPQADERIAYCPFCKKKHPGGSTCMGHYP